MKSVSRGGKLKRVLLSLLASVLAVTVCGVAMCLKTGVRDLFELRGSILIFLYWSYAMLCFGLPGWVLAIPAILLLTDLRAWRFWALLALGAAIGPVTLYFELTWLRFHGRPGSKSDWIAFLTALIVSLLSALIYLLLLRRSQSSMCGEATKTKPLK